jgi:hypothetical protein
MQTVEGLVAKVADGIWIGNSNVSSAFMRVNDISAVVKLDNDVIVGPDIDCFTYALPDAELLNEEIPRVVTKLSTVCNIINEMRGVGRNIIIQCSSGKNKSAVVAGFYLTRYLGQKRDVVTEQLSAVYFSPEQVVEDRAERERARKIKNGEDVPPMTQIDITAQGLRRSRQALSNLSFRKIIQLP